MVSLLKGMGSTLVFTQIPESQYIPNNHSSQQTKLMESMGKLSATNQSTRVLAWSVPALNSPCYDGQNVRHHLYQELKLHSVMERSTNRVVAPLLGLMEKRNNLGSELHECYHIEPGFTRFSEMLGSMGGLVKIPALVLSG